MSGRALVAGRHRGLKPAYSLTAAYVRRSPLEKLRGISDESVDYLASIMRDGAYQTQYRVIAAKVLLEERWREENHALACAPEEAEESVEGMTEPQLIEQSIAYLRSKGHIEAETVTVGEEPKGDDYEQGS